MLQTLAAGYLALITIAAVVGTINDWSTAVTVTAEDGATDDVAEVVGETESD